ncbi:hypothetical protein IJI28_02630 [Candidatus Saccharibacteria bacterium]|nr:hypothetical protein [Candidatus Saccharibacteria bacterium]
MESNSEDYIMINNTNTKNTKKTWLIVVGISLIVITTIVIVILASRNTQTRYEHMIKVEGYNELDVSIPLSVREDFGAQLYYLLEQYHELSMDSSEEVAVIRGESLTKDLGGEIKMVSFIVDIDNLQQTYRIVLNWSDTEEVLDNVSIECVSKSESNYPDTECHGMTTSSESIVYLLPNTLNLKNGQKVQLEYGFTTSDGKDIVTIVVGSCGNKDLEKNALSAAEEWVESQGFDLDEILFEMNSVYKNCSLKGDK